MKRSGSVINQPPRKLLASLAGDLDIGICDAGATARNDQATAIVTPRPEAKRSPLSAAAADALTAAADAVAAFSVPMFPASIMFEGLDADAGEVEKGAKGVMKDERIEKDAADDDKACCLVTGSVGANVLSDFPHARENCANFKFSPTQAPLNLDHCPNCFCFACDVPVAECKAWSQHAHACCASANWLGIRHRNQLKLGLKGDASSSASPSVEPLPPSNACGQGVVDFAGLAPDDPSCHALLQKIEQVWPVETPSPSGVLAVLRPYQAQSLAFMLARERVAEASACGRLTTTRDPLGMGLPPEVRAAFHNQDDDQGVGAHDVDYTTRGGWLCDEMGMGKTLCVIALVVSNPCSDHCADEGAWATWERRRKTTPPPPRHECVAVEPSHINLSGLDERTRWVQTEAFTKYLASCKPPVHKASSLDANGRLKAKATLVFTSISLFGQWEDEIKRFAPSLVVHRYHATGKGTGETYLRKAQVRAADVILLSPHNHLDPFFATVAWHRVVVDESHENNFATSASPLFAAHRWCCTGTPFTTSLTELRVQAAFLGLDRVSLVVAHADGSSRPLPSLQALIDPVSSLVGAVQDGTYEDYGEEYSESSNKAQEEALRSKKSLAKQAQEAGKTLTGCLVRLLREVMIRHTKAQQMGNGERGRGGRVALALPASVATTEWLDMTTDERTLYTMAMQRSTDALLGAGAAKAVHRSHFEAKVAVARQACGQCYPPLAPGYYFGGTAYQAAYEAFQRRGAAGGTKIQALLKDLAALHKVEPAMHCVVFTASNESHALLVSVLSPLYEVCAFKEGERATKRDAAIRLFQQGLKQGAAAAAQGRTSPGAAGSDGVGSGAAPGGAKATIFVVTMKAGAVGITLTAATRCYLMQPCLDPAAEMQAAGRIHRLGQNKEVFVKRFAFRNSLDERIIQLHGKVERGEIKIADGYLTLAAQDFLLN